MRLRLGILLPLVVLLALSASLLAAQVDPRWKPNDPERPMPPAIDPGTVGTQDVPGLPPSDAIVLFDGKDLSQWLGEDDRAPRWKVQDGYMEVAPDSGYIHTRRAFGDCQLHVEFNEPKIPTTDTQDAGNSGIFLMGLYEVQVLERWTYSEKIYADGIAGAVYSEFPPQVNASRPAGIWQMYDIIFHRPRFSKNGRVQLPARLTVLYNGVLVQDNVELSGPTVQAKRPPYKQGPDALPLSLQDHHDPVRYRNIWIRELTEEH